MQTYKWISTVPDDLPFTIDLLSETHRRIVTGGDDDHCVPGKTRESDHNVIFGSPAHRGCEGGEECTEALAKLVDAVRHGFREHDPLIQALALHYHFAAMHPFEDGNGRTARALEALFLQRAGMRDSTFIAMSNFYYDEKKNYLTTLSEVRKLEYDLTPFLKFGLRGIALQSQRLANEIRRHVSIEVFRSLMFDFFGRLQTKRKRVIAKRQIAILEHILGITEIEWAVLYKDLIKLYGDVMNKDKALIRDMNHLISLGAVAYRNEPIEKSKMIRSIFWARLEWPTEITETEFFRKVSTLPRVKGQLFISH
jgi:Fic family protein